MEALFLQSVSWGDFGLTGLIVGLIVIPIITFFLGFVNTARSDLRDSNTAFTDYLKETASKQTEALVSVGNALQRSIEAASYHEVRAAKRHAQVLAAMGKSPDPLDE